jgi:hypothetical protein
LIELAVKGDPKKRLRSLIKVIDEHVAILDAKMLQLVHSFDEDKDSERLYMESLNAFREDIQFSMG